MNILLVNPKYAQTFWSFNQTVEMLGKRAVQPPLALITLAALLPEDWHFNLVDLMVHDLTETDWQNADAVMITGMTTQYSGIVSLIEEGKARGKTVVVGGPLVFHFPEEALRLGADIVVKGEAEPVVRELIEAVQGGSSGIILEAADKPDLGLAPVPRFDLLDLDRYIDMAIQLSRGCPYHCEFCDVTLMLGRKMRMKTPEQALRELQVLYDLGWRRGVFIVDDNFIGSLSAARAFLKELAPWMESHGHPFDFNVQASVNLASHPDILELMVRNSFWKVFLGIETTDVENLKSAGKHQNAAVDLVSVCETINRAGMQIIAGCILGFDGEKSGAGDRLLELAETAHIPELFVTLLQAGPGTDLWKRLEREGRLRETLMDDNYGSQTAGINFLPTRPEAEIVQEFIDLYEKLYEPAAYMKRSYECFSRMENNPPKKRRGTITVSELKAICAVIWRQGIVSPSRLTFWKNIIISYLRFPRLLDRYFCSFITAEHYYEYRHTIKKSLAHRLRENGERAADEAASVRYSRIHDSLQAP